MDAHPPTAPAAFADAGWQSLLDGIPTQDPAFTLYTPLTSKPRAPDGCFVLARIAQSLDGRIATTSGDSFWITGEADLLHTHRLRALSDAVIVGAATVRADDPQLTTRRCAGPSPVRVIVDVERRLSEDYRVFRSGPRSLLFCGNDADGPDQHGVAEVVRIGRSPGQSLDPHAILAALASRGLHRVFVEGGGITVSRFLAAGAVDRLHVTVAPLILGAGVPAFSFPCPGRPDHGMRLRSTTHRLGDDTLFDIAVDRSKPPMC